MADSSNRSGKKTNSKPTWRYWAAFIVIAILVVSWSNRMPKQTNTHRDPEAAYRAYEAEVQRGMRHLRRRREIGEGITRFFIGCAVIAGLGYGWYVLSTPKDQRRGPRRE